MGCLGRWQRQCDGLSSFSLVVSKQELAKHLADVSDAIGPLPRFSLAALVFIFWLLQVLAFNITYLHPFSKDFPNLMGATCLEMLGSLCPSLLSSSASPQLVAHYCLMWGCKSPVPLPLGGTIL